LRRGGGLSEQRLAWAASKTPSIRLQRIRLQRIRCKTTEAELAHETPARDDSRAPGVALITT
jgi:hypothetical protein